jgi:hypothetical protein
MGRQRALNLFSLFEQILGGQSISTLGQDKYPIVLA